MSSPSPAAAILALFLASIASASTCSISLMELENQSKRISAIGSGSGELGEILLDDREETATRLRDFTAATIQPDRTETGWGNAAAANSPESPQISLAAFLASLHDDSLIPLSNAQLPPPPQASSFCILCTPGGPAEALPTLSDLPPAPFDPLLCAGAGLPPGPAIGTPKAATQFAPARFVSDSIDRVATLSVEPEFLDPSALTFLACGAFFLSIATFCS